MRILGIDLGSRFVKVAIMEDGIIKEKFKISTVKFYKEYCRYDGRLKVDFKRLGIEGFDVGVSTGYGRNNVDIESFRIINELKAHAYGAIYQTKLKDFVLLDVGGQDVKVIKVEKGILTDLELNDKCAASCGRYLENMAKILETDLEDLSRYFEDPVELNSTCAVFSESELIGKIAEGYSFESLCAGVNYSLYNRLRPLLSKFKGRMLLLSGGVAKNMALIEYLKRDFDEVKVLDEPEFNGAIGCCYFGSLKG